MIIHIDFPLWPSALPVTAYESNRVYQCAAAVPVYCTAKALYLGLLVY